MKDDEYIKRIIKYCKRIQLYLQAIHSFDEFVLDNLRTDAIILNLEQIGETSKKLSNQAKLKFSNINWPSIIGLRNMISHEYEGVNINIIYDIVLNRIPELLTELEK